MAHVFEKHGDGYWDKVFKDEWGRHREVPQRNEFCLLCVEVDERPNRVGIGIKREENAVDIQSLLVPLGIHFRVLLPLNSKLRAEDYWLSLKDIALLLQ